MNIVKQYLYEKKVSDSGVKRIFSSYLGQCILRSTESGHVFARANFVNYMVPHSPTTVYDCEKQCGTSILPIFQTYQMSLLSTYVKTNWLISTSTVTEIGRIESNQATICRIISELHLPELASPRTCNKF